LQPPFVRLEKMIALCHKGRRTVVCERLGSGWSRLTGEQVQEEQMIGVWMMPRHDGN